MCKYKGYGCASWLVPAEGVSQSSVFLCDVAMVSECMYHLIPYAYNFRECKLTQQQKVTISWGGMAGVKKEELQNSTKNF